MTALCIALVCHQGPKGECFLSTLGPCNHVTSPNIINIMPLHLKTQGAPAGFVPKDTLTLGEDDGCTNPKEHRPQKALQMEATILGVVQILCGLAVSAMGIILASAAFSSRRSPVVSSSVTSGFPLAGGLSAQSSLVSSAVSSAAAGAGGILLTYSLVALGTAAPSPSPKQDCLSSVPNAEYYYSIYELKDCLLADFSLTGTLIVMLAFMGLELLMAAYTSVFWYRQICSAKPGVYFACFPSQDYIQGVKKSSKSWV